MKSIQLCFSLLKSLSRLLFVVSFFVTMLFLAKTVLADETQIETQTHFERFNMSLPMHQASTIQTQILSDLNHKLDEEDLLKNKSIAPSAEGDKGYLITVSFDKDFERTITKDPELVVQIFEKHLGTNLDIIKIIKQSPYFDIKTDGIYFYAEVGKVRQGKNGKLKFRKIKKSEKIKNL
jgi:hypothetical protein